MEGSRGVHWMVKSGMGCQQQADCPRWGNQSPKDGEGSHSFEGCSFLGHCRAVVSGESCQTPVEGVIRRK